MSGPARTPCIRRAVAALAVASLFLTRAVHGRQDAAIVYLADGAPGRVADLAASLAALDAHFNARFRYPVLIFHDDEEAGGGGGGGGSEAQHDYRK